MASSVRDAMRLWTLAVPTVSAYVNSIVHDFQERDDVLQETAVAVMECFGRYDATKPFIAWAIGIARNQVRLYLRTKGRHRVVFDSEALDRLAAAFAETASTQDRRLDRLGECIESMDRKSKQLCQLRYENDLKPAAIAEQMGLEANTVAKALQRIRERLQECVERKELRKDGV